MPRLTAGYAGAGSTSPRDESLPPELPEEKEKEDPTIAAAAGPAQASCVALIISGGGGALAGPSSRVYLVHASGRYRGVPNRSLPLLSAVSRCLPAALSSAEEVAPNLAFGGHI